METLSGSAGRRDVRAVIAGAAVAGNALKMVCIFAEYLADSFSSLSPLWSCAISAFCIPREPEGPLAPGTEVSGLLLALPHVQPKQKKKLG